MAGRQRAGGFLDELEEPRRGEHGGQNPTARIRGGVLGQDAQILLGAQPGCSIEVLGSHRTTSPVGLSAAQRQYAAGADTKPAAGSSAPGGLKRTSEVLIPGLGGRGAEDLVLTIA